MSTIAQTLARRGWARVAADAASTAWAEAAARAARQVLDDPDHRARSLQCQGTWFVGVDALPTAPDGAVAGVALAGQATRALDPMPPLHPAQLSVIYPGYPKPRGQESAAAFAFRRDRRGAHVDGLIADPTDRLRRVVEPHAWILGIGLWDAPPDAAPLAVWDGAHAILGAALRAALAGVTDPATQDVTAVYQAARRDAFARCAEIHVPLQRGEAVILHRHMLHGIAPWRAAPNGARAVAYFRPLHPAGHAGWASDSA